MGQKIDLEGSVPDMIRFLRETIESTSVNADRHIFTLDYDIPVKTVRNDILSIIDSAEGVGAIKGELYDLDEQLELVKLRHIMKYMRIDKRLRDPEAAILEFGKSIWSRQFSREKLLSCASGDMEEASCYMLCRYAFTWNKQREFEQAMTSDEANPAKEFKNIYCQTYDFLVMMMNRFLARYVKSLGKKCDVLDMKNLPDEIELVRDSISYFLIIIGHSEADA